MMVGEKIPAQVACRVLAVSESGYYERLKRARLSAPCGTPG